MSNLKTLAEWMAELHVDQAALVKSSGLDAKVVEAIVAGRYTTSPQQRRSLASALGISPDDIRWGQAMPVDHLYGHGPQFGRSP